MTPRNRIQHPLARESAHLQLHKISFTIQAFKWSTVASMMHELNVDPQILKEALSTGHGVEFDVDDDPELFFVFDSEMRQKLQDSNFTEPTTAQLIGTSRCVGLSEQDAREKFTNNFLGTN